MDTLLLALRVLVALGAVVALLWVLQRRSLRWAAKHHSGTTIEVAGKRSLGSKASVVVVDVDGTRFTLGVTEHSVNVLHSSRVPAQAEAGEAPLAPRAVPPLRVAGGADDEAATAAGVAGRSADAARHVRAEDSHPVYDFARMLGRAESSAVFSRSQWRPLAKTRKSRH
ncbi:MAG TPA: flagellar biosynthetic protein FliO [Microbacteriaceae bacterium]|nr:flagellar biosynthetic protein FliO [Microbacteriaceae bacterium]